MQVSHHIHYRMHRVYKRAHCTWAGLIKHSDRQKFSQNPADVACLSGGVASWLSEMADFLFVCIHTSYQAETHTVSWHFGGFWSHSPSIVTHHDSRSLPSSSSKSQHTMIAILSVRGLWSHLTLRTWSVFLILTKINLLLSRWILCACNCFDSHIQ